MPSLKIKRAKSRAKNKDREQLDKALEEELKETFPASDAVAVIEPAPPAPTAGRETDAE